MRRVVLQAVLLAGLLAAVAMLLDVAFDAAMRHARQDPVPLPHDAPAIRLSRVA